MPIAKLSGVHIAYLDEGEGFPILLIHGFASNKEVNWLNTGWIKALTKAKFRVIALDNRGHGESQKFYNGDSYHLSNMAGDAFQLMEYLDIDRYSVMGYSMGARICSYMGVYGPKRIQRMVLGGNGDSMIRSINYWHSVVQGLKANSIEEIQDLRSRTFRIFAEQTSSDLKALAACLGGASYQFSENDFRSINIPVFVVVGSKDDIAGSGASLVKLLPKGYFLNLEGYDHMRTVGCKTFVTDAIRFLKDN